MREEALDELGEVVLSEEHDAFRWCAREDLSALGVPPQLVAAARHAWPPG
jgi:hypothetical protein